MCTTVAVGGYFGRNMDLDCSFGERVVMTPRRYRLAFRQSAPLEEHYAMIGMAATVEEYPLYADAMNEKGLCMAGLNFPVSAFYPQSANANRYNVSPFELIPWLLGQCATLAEVRELLAQTHLIAVPFSHAIPLTPLHWHIADTHGSLVLESTRDGMRVYEDPVEVLTNNPPFSFQLAELARYAHLSPNATSDECFAQLQTAPFGMGLGAFGLPGDYSSPSRFVKAAWLRRYAAWEGGEGTVPQMFHVLASVAPPKGAVLTTDGKAHYTIYSACMDTPNSIYHYQTYFDRQTRSVPLRKTDLNATHLSQYPLSPTCILSDSVL